MDSYMMGKRTEEQKYVAHNKNRFEYVLNLIDQPKKILDIGTSPFTFMLRKKYPNTKIWTIDYSSKFEKRCQKAGIFFKKIDLEKDRLVFNKNKFETITFLEVLEHLKTDHFKIIKEIFKLLAKNGKCILQTPNKFSPKSIFVNMISESNWEKFSNTSPGKEEFRHFKEYSLRELVSLIQKIKNLRIVTAERPLYFDDIDSAMVYRKFPILLKPLVYLNYFLVKAFPFFRRGMTVVFTNTQLAETFRLKQG